QATSVHRLDRIESTENAHMEASKVMLDHADRLFAVWDGKPARGYGGTADVVAEARDGGIPVTVIWPEGASRDQAAEALYSDSEAEPLPTDWWPPRDVAPFLNVMPPPIRAYVAGGQMPSADRRIGREPVWRPATIRKWHSQRPRLARDAAEQPH